MANNWDVYKTQVKQKAIINVPDLVHQSSYRSYRAAAASKNIYKCNNFAQILKIIHPGTIFIIVACTLNVLFGIVCIMMSCVLRKLKSNFCICKQRLLWIPYGE